MIALEAARVSRLLRKTTTLCPECARSMEGAVVERDGRVLLERQCPEHGRYAFPLSDNGPLYADLDRFYFLLKGDDGPQGRITNYWLLPTGKCQMHCEFCSLEVQQPFFEEMSLAQLDECIERYGRAKLTFAGGEPTLHPQVLQFFEHAADKKVTTQLATNGVLLSSKSFCRKLAEARVKEVRISFQAFDRDCTFPGGTERFFDAKQKAMENLRELNIPTSLAITIFKGMNDDQLVKALEFARDKLFIREVSVNGFAWTGHGLHMSRDHMIMPDQLMDLLFRRYGGGSRGDLYTLQKILLTVLQLLRIRLCLYTQIMIFVREKQGLRPITEYLAMKRLARGMTWWERFARSGRIVQAAAMALVLAGGLRLRSLRLLLPALRLLVANIRRIAIHRYPSKLVPVVLNTNCATPNADSTVGVQCMSADLFVEDGRLRVAYSTEVLLEHDQERKQPLDPKREPPAATARA